MRLTWRREPREKGLTEMVQGERGWDLAGQGRVIARVRPLTNGINPWIVLGWYWYGGDESLGIARRNTCHEPVPTADEAKAQCLSYVKAAPKSRKEIPNDDHHST